MTDQTTWIDMSNHVYWDLSGRFDGTALRQALKIAADQVTINDENHLIIKFVPEKDAFDFAIIKNIRWRVEMEGDGIHRKEIPEIPIDALREAVINSFAHARYDLPVQHEIDIYSDRISIINPGSFANEFEPIDFVKRDIHSFLRNETIARVLYLCKDVETFGSGIRKIYSLCNTEGIEIRYENDDTAFSIAFSREDRNKLPLSGQKNGKINDHISALEQTALSLLRDDPRLTYAELILKTGKSQRTLSRVMDALKRKGLITRAGSNKTGYWQVM